MGTRQCYFASANSSAGYVSYFDSVLRSAERVYIIKGGPGCGKSTFMKRMGNDLLSTGMDVDFIYCPSDKESLDGIYIHEINTAVVNGSFPHVIEPKYPGAVERILDFSNFWDIDYLRLHKKSIREITDCINQEYDKFFGYMKKAKDIHDSWEKEYAKGMNYKMADEMTKSIIDEVVKVKTDRPSEEYHRFAGALTPQGQLSFYENLTEKINNRYIMKGRPGSGKSTLTKRIARAAKEAGYDVELYHCSFDPDSIDMLRIPELDFAILDGTQPHMLDPDDNDHLVDMFLCIDTDIVHEEEDPIKAISIQYADEIGKAKKVYTNIAQLNKELEEYYINATDFNDVNALRIRITKTLVDLNLSLKL